MNPYSQHRPQFIPFTVLGDPDKTLSIEIIETLIANGATSLELGLPFSDPPADGPVIQAADVRALEAGITVDDCFEILRDIRSRHSLPIGLLVYVNLIAQRGVEQFYADCAAAGVTSVLVADLPLEHADEYVSAAKKHEVQPVFMVSPLTTDERLEQIAGIAEGYLYVVSYCGVTGVQDNVLQDTIAETILRCRNATDLPLIVGFGINTEDHIRSALAAGADGVIVGSRLVREVPDTKKIGEVCSELVAAIQ